MHKRVKKTICPNCGYSFTGADNFCPACGQENHTHQLPLKHFVLEFFESLFHFDTKFFHTVRDLFLKPGMVTKNYNANKRAGYVPPFRFYLFTSAIYFLVLAAVEPPGIEVVDKVTEQQRQESTVVISSGFTPEQKKELRELAAKDTLAWDDIRAFHVKHGKKTARMNLLNTWFLIRAMQSDQASTGHRLVRNISYLMFLLMPLFALLLSAFYRKKKLFYSAHLVFSVHFHTLAFILLLAGFLPGNIFPGFNFSGIVLLAILLYLLFSLKNVFEESWIKTVLKTVALSLCYLVFFIISLLAATIGSVV